MSAHPDSRWTHPVCDDCWFRSHTTPDPLGGPTLLDQPTRLVDEFREWEQCCRCGSMTCAGIYERGDPNDDDFKWWCMESAERKTA